MIINIYIHQPSAISRLVEILISHPCNYQWSEAEARGVGFLAISERNYKAPYTSIRACIRTNIKR